jgi:hypothetical protein
MKLPTTMTARMSRGRTQDWAVEVNGNDVCMQGKRGRMPFLRSTINNSSTPRYPKESTNYFANKINNIP